MRRPSLSGVARKPIVFIAQRGVRGYESVQCRSGGRNAQRRSRPALFCLVCLTIAGSAAAAEPAHVALVIADAAYAGMPALPGCLASAHEAAGVLARAGFAVTERHDLSNGETDGAIAEFTARLAGPPAGTGVIYLCGYTTSYAGRAFVLPVSARLERETDVLTQGLPAASLPATLARAGAPGGLVLLDLIPAPQAATPGAGLDTLAAGGSAPAIGLVAALEPGGQAETPLAQTLAAAITPPTVQVAPVIAGIEQALATTAGLKLWVHLPPGEIFLTGAPPPPPPPPPPAPVVAAAPPPTPPPAPPAPPPARMATAQPPPAAPLPPPLPEEERMTDADRRRLQGALVALGYYPGPVDGLFGPDTRAAFRRFQHELGAEMTGRLTGPQAQQLLARGK
jgi:hypothetical protein